MSNKDIKKKILDAVAQVRAKGYTLVCEDWGDPAHECACPLTALIYVNEPASLEAKPIDHEAAAAKILGVNEDWVISFLEGFDGNGTADASKLPEAWKVGAEIRKETKPIVYHLWDGEAVTQ